MEHYKEYLAALKATFQAYKEQQQRRSAAVVTRFENEERNLRGQYERKTAALRKETDQSLQKLSRDMSAVLHDGGSRQKTLSDELQELRARESALRTEYEELKQIADAKAAARGKQRRNLFRFWWSTVD